MVTSPCRILLVSGVKPPSVNNNVSVVATYGAAVEALSNEGPWHTVHLSHGKLAHPLAVFLANNPGVLPKIIHVSCRDEVDIEAIKNTLEDHYKNISKDGFEFSGRARPVGGESSHKRPVVISRGDFTLDRSLYFTAHSLDQFRAQTKRREQAQWNDRTVIEYLADRWREGEVQSVGFIRKFKKYGLDSLDNEHRYTKGWILSKASNNHIVTVHFKGSL